MDRRGTLMKVNTTKLFITAFYLLSLILLTACVNTDKSSEFIDNTSTTAIEVSKISHLDTRPTLDTLAACIAPHTTLIKIKI